MNNFKSGFISFGLGINAIFTLAFLGVVYYLGIGVTALIVKFSKRRLFDLNFNNKKKTYWEKLNLKTKPIEEYLKQF